MTLSNASLILFRSILGLLLLVNLDLLQNLPQNVELVQNLTSSVNINKFTLVVPASNTYIHQHLGLLYLSSTFPVFVDMLPLLLSTLDLLIFCCSHQHSGLPFTFTINP